MEKADVDLIHQLKNEDSQLHRYWTEHLELERKLESFQKKGFLSTEEEQEVRRLKKRKLAGRDEIERILAEHRAHA